MTKEEKIKKAYGGFYKPEKYHFSVNGWVDLNEWLEYEVGQLIDEIDMEFREYSARPKSLQGIEDNNGWIKINENLPTKTGYYLMYDGKNTVLIELNNTTDMLTLREQFIKDGFTHYQPIVKPKPPIY